jgi:hypothetical protein
VRLSSIRAAWDESQRTQARFPLVLLSAAIATAMGWLVVKDDSSSHRTAVLAAATLGLALFTAVAVASERARSRYAGVVINALAIAGLIAIAWAWSTWPNAVQVRRFAQFGIGFHLLVAFLAYVGVREPNGFWQFNRILFLRFCLAAVYSGVLFIGLVVALVAINQLFKAHIASTVYARLWITIAFLFNTWFFLAGVPRDLPALEARSDYPTGLKVFTQFVLLPLVVIYLLILTTYLVRILVTGQWPSGWIGYLVSSVATVGILSLLLVHPIREREGNRWVSTYARWFYVALLPSIVMLLVAIGKRIRQYGITEDRYFVAVLALWLAGIALLYIARRNTGIRIIPATLCVLAFVTAFGPQGAYSVSLHSQQSRLSTLLAQAGIVRGGRANPTGDVPFDVRREMSATLAYLIESHGLSSLRRVLGDSPAFAAADSMKGTGYGQGEWRARVIMNRLGLEYVTGSQPQTSTYFSYYARQGPESQAIPISDVDYHVRLLGSLPREFQIDTTSWEFGPGRHGQAIRLVTSGHNAAEFPTDTLVTLARLYGAADVRPWPRITVTSDYARATLVVISFAGFRDRDSTRITNLEGDLYLKIFSAAHP